MPETPIKLAVVTPWSSPFMFTDYVDAQLNLKHPPGCEVRFFRGSGWCPALRHINGCNKAIEWGADYICITGADQVHPADMLCRLMEDVIAGCDVIACLVPCRGYVHWQPMLPFQPMAWRFKYEGENGYTTDMKCRAYGGMEADMDMIHIVDRKDGRLQKVNFIGSGVILFPADALLSLKEPWFRETVDPATQQRIANMDCTFVWRLQQEAYQQVWVDTEIIVKHAHVFQIDDSFQERFADWARGGGDPTICRVKAGVN